MININDSGEKLAEKIRPLSLLSLMTSPSLSLSTSGFPPVYNLYHHHPSVTQSVYKFTQFSPSNTHPMSVAFEPNNHNNNNNNRIQLQLQQSMWVSSIPDTSRFTGGYPWSSTLPAVKEEDDTTSSSIGNNSDAFSAGAGDDDSGDNDTEVQSKDNNNNINNGMLNGLSDLEQVLPIKRGISTFYAGKSKSYGSLDEAVSIPTIQDIVKPEDAYSRKRKNMIAHHVLSGFENGVSKRLARIDQSVAMAGRSLPPLPRSSRNVHVNELPAGMYVSSRSLSLSDLQHASSYNGVIDNESKMDGN